MVVLPVCPNGDVRIAMWSKLDPEEALRPIPDLRTMSLRRTRVWLTSGPLNLPNQATMVEDEYDLRFSPGQWHTPLAGATISLLPQTSTICCFPHGFRSSFRNWRSETGVQAAHPCAPSPCRQEHDRSHLCTLRSAGDLPRGTAALKRLPSETREHPEL